MNWFLAKRIALADAVYGSTVAGVYLDRGLLWACAAAAGLGVALSIARQFAGADK